IPFTTTPLIRERLARLFPSEVSDQVHFGIVLAWLLAGGNLTPAPSFSAEEAMVMRGRIEDARLTLESRLAENPDDLPVRLHLAALVRDRQADYAAAERLYLEGRSWPGADARADTFANLLIDLYQKTGNRGRLIVELARYAERHRGTPAGLGAKRRLDELKAEIQANSG
ncbi:MAG: hypothetical protein AB7R55_16150, partial [Gemmatimonadales bacterium]